MIAISYLAINAEIFFGGVIIDAVRGATGHA
jgi:hypothetical protein